MQEEGGKYGEQVQQRQYVTIIERAKHKQYKQQQQQVQQSQQVTGGRRERGSLTRREGEGIDIWCLELVLYAREEKRGLCKSPCATPLAFLEVARPLVLGSPQKEGVYSLWDVKPPATRCKDEQLAGCQLLLRGLAASWRHATGCRDPQPTGSIEKFVLQCSGRVAA